MYSVLIYQGLAFLPGDDSLIRFFSPQLKQMENVKKTALAQIEPRPSERDYFKRVRVSHSFLPCKVWEQNKLREKKKRKSRKPRHIGSCWAVRKFSTFRVQAGMMSYACVGREGGRDGRDWRRSIRRCSPWGVGRLGANARCWPLFQNRFALVIG